MERVPFYTEKRFYDNTDIVFVAPYPRHPYFKEQIGSWFKNISCNCLHFQKGRCNNCKIICFNISFLVDKIKLGHYLDVTSTVDIVLIETCLEKMNSMLLSYFWRGCFTVQCSLDQLKYISLLEKKSPLNLTCDFFCRF